MTSIKDRIINKVTRRAPDFIIGGADDPYLLRWFVIPRNRIFNIYLHKFIRSDDDRALHDHPWTNLSILLRGCYVEHTIASGGCNVAIKRVAGEWKLRLLGTFAHRLELVDGPCWTLFITGPRYRAWGFHCPDSGWVHWEDFTKQGNSAEVGKGCNQ
jgi:hypothetical protein